MIHAITRKKDSGQTGDSAIWGRSDSIPPLRRRYDLARRKMENDLDMKTACEMSAKSTNGGLNENRDIEGLAPISTQDCLYIRK